MASLRDRVQIQQVLINLRMNAMNAMDAAGGPLDDRYPATLRGGWSPYLTTKRGAAFHVERSLAAGSTA